MHNNRPIPCQLQRRVTYAVYTDTPLRNEAAWICLMKTCGIASSGRGPYRTPARDSEWTATSSRHHHVGG